jgi:hypothetical protein
MRAGWPATDTAVRPFEMKGATTSHLCLCSAGKAGVVVRCLLKCKRFLTKQGGLVSHKLGNEDRS